MAGGETSRDVQVVLCRSDQYTVIKEFEVVMVSGQSVPGGDVVIGDFYGDPDSAVITSDEQWCVMVGEGLIAYRLREPWNEYVRDGGSENWWEVGRSDAIVWFESARVEGSRVHVDDEEGVIYFVDFEARSLVRLIDE